MGAEVDEQSYRDSGCFEVVDRLGLMFREECFDGFEFDEDVSFNTKIGVELPDDLGSESVVDTFL